MFDQEVKPLPPTHLDEIARHEWQRIIPQLAQADGATLSLLEGYCVSYSRWRTAEAELKKSGPVVRSPAGGAMQSPWLSVSRAALRDATKCLAELGLTPKRKKVAKADDDDATELHLLDVG